MQHEEDKVEARTKNRKRKEKPPSRENSQTLAISVTSILEQLDLKTDTQTMKTAIVDIYCAGQIGVPEYGEEMNNIPRSILSCMMTIQFWFDYFINLTIVDDSADVTLLDVSISPVVRTRMLHLCRTDSKILLFVILYLVGRRVCRREYVIAKSVK
jgi:hypothetical protein